MGHPDTQIGAGQSQFPPTAWSLLAQLRDPSDPVYKAHLERMMALYWRPVYKFVRLAWKRSNEDAKDLTQSFFIQLLEGSLLRSADPDRGNFRKFLITALRNFLSNVERGTQAIKRGGAHRILSLDEEDALPVASDAPDPGTEFENQWARGILERSIDQLSHKVRPNVFKAFQLFHLEGESVRHIAARLKASETQVAHHLQDARSILRLAVIEEIRGYVQDEQELQQELEALFQSWR
jgi:RNA polymerase sigma factor (sigma-70 family)